MKEETEFDKQIKFKEGIGLPAWIQSQTTTYNATSAKENQQTPYPSPVITSTDSLLFEKHLLQKVFRLEQIGGMHITLQCTPTAYKLPIIMFDVCGSLQLTHDWLILLRAKTSQFIHNFSTVNIIVAAMMNYIFSPPTHSSY